MSNEDLTKKSSNKVPSHTSPSITVATTGSDTKSNSLSMSHDISGKPNNSLRSTNAVIKKSINSSAPNLSSNNSGLMKKKTVFTIKQAIEDAAFLNDDYESNKSTKASSNRFAIEDDKQLVASLSSWGGTKDDDEGDDDF